MSRAYAVERARAAACSMFVGLMPGSTGANMADEIAEKVPPPGYCRQR
ncbi:hypothetical protein OHU45_37410 [Streptomyces tubercidicus]